MPYAQELGGTAPGELPPDDALWRGAKGDFAPLARKWHETFRLHCAVEPHHRVLEIGCGAGRMATPFAEFLTTGSYVGVDISEEAIAWAAAHAGSSKLAFRHLDLKNPHYRKDAGADAAATRLPFDDGSFDFIFLASVFTHLASPEAANYIAECARLLKSGGYLLGTYFLLSRFSQANIERRLSRYYFKHRTDDHTRDETTKPRGKATGLDQEFVLRSHADAGLLTRVVIGAWSHAQGVKEGKARADEFPPYRHSQDIVVAFKDGRG